MSSTQVETLREKLINKLAELLQLNQPDLDFGFYRIMQAKDFEYATVFANGSNNLPNLKKEEDRWKVRLIEEELMPRMWDVS